MRRDKSTNWSRIVKDWSQSGLTQKEYCRKNKINFYKFQYWRKKTPKDPGRMLVKISNSIKPFSENSSSRCHIKLPNGITIRVEDDFATDRLSEIIKCCSI